MAAKATNLTAQLFTAEGEKKGERELPSALFDGTVHEPAMWQTVKAYLANQRRSNASTKTYAMIAGGGRKPWRQKGTGRARVGTIRAAHWRGGAVIFGPSPERNHRQSVPKKVRWLARRSAYNARAGEGAVLLFERLGLEEYKTKRIIALLEGAGATGNVLILTDGHQPFVQVSARNIPRVRVRPFGEESAYDLLWSNTVLIETTALDRAGEVAHA